MVRYLSRWLCWHTEALGAGGQRDNVTSCSTSCHDSSSEKQDDNQHNTSRIVFWILVYYSRLPGAHVETGNHFFNGYMPQDKTIVCRSCSEPVIAKCKERLSIVLDALDPPTCMACMTPTLMFFGCSPFWYLSQPEYYEQNSAFLYFDCSIGNPLIRKKKKHSLNLRVFSKLYSLNFGRLLPLQSRPLVCWTPSQQHFREKLCLW